MVPDVSLVVQVDGEGRVFVGAERQLFSLNRDLVLQQNVSLPSGVRAISLGSGGERLMVCTEDGSCAVYNSSHLSAGPSAVWPAFDFRIQRAYISIIERVFFVYNNIALFTSENAFYVGSSDESNTALRLAQYGGFQGSSNFERSTNYTIGRQYGRVYFCGGFVSGGNAYYIIIGVRTVKVMRVCDDGCSGSAKCGFNALHVETIECGSPDGYICEVQLVEGFAGTEGPSVILTRCDINSFTVCLVPVAEIDAAMDSNFNDCKDRPTTTASELFGNGRVNCTDLQVSCDKINSLSLTNSRLVTKYV